MKDIQIAGVGTANPDTYMTQKEVFSFYKKHNLLPSNQKPLYEELLLDGPIEGRYFGLDNPSEVLNESADAKNARFATHGRRIAAEASRSALTDAGLCAGDVGALVVNSCTGYLCPGLTSYLAEDLGLSPYTKVIDIMGMGCGSAVPNLECGCGLLERTSGKPVLCVAVEACSATHLIDDDPGLTVSNCIFGDGAAAVVLREANDSNGLYLVDFESGVFPEHREALRYKNEAGHLRNSLNRRVPVVGAQCLEKVATRLLTRQGLTVADIGWWAVHAGGKAVLDQVGKKFGLYQDELETSRQVFATYGNMSSPTALFVLQKLRNRQATRGPGLLAAFGAGFTAFTALIKHRK